MATKPIKVAKAVIVFFMILKFGLLNVLKNLIEIYLYN